MVSSITSNKALISGALLIAGCCLVLSYPAIVGNEDGMLNDDYAYDDHDEQASPSPQSRPSSMEKAERPHANKTLVKTGVLGEDIVLKCDEPFTKKNVILWYQESKMIATGVNLVQPNFEIDPKTFDLKILKASPLSAGNYYCEIEPNKIFVHTKVILGEHSLDVITPESSTSAQDSLHRFALMWLLAVGVALHQYKH